MIAACVLAASLWAPVFGNSSRGAAVQEPAAVPVQTQAPSAANQAPGAANQAPTAANQAATTANSEQKPELTPEQRAKREQELAAKREKLPSLFEGAFTDTSNGQDFSESVGYWHLLELLYAYPPEEVSKRVRSDFVYDDCMAEPDLWRGEFIKVRGLLAGCQAVRLKHPIAGHEDVWRGVVTEADASEGIVFDMLDRPSDELVDRRSVVDLEGLVYRTVSYEANAGNVREAPYVLARSLKPVDTDKVKKRSVAEPFIALLLACAVAFLVGRILLTMRGRAKAAPPPGESPGFHELFRRKARNATRGPKDAPKQ